MIKDVRWFPLCLGNSFVVHLLLKNLVSAQFPKIEMHRYNVTYQKRMVWYLRLEPSSSSSSSFFENKDLNLLACTLFWHETIIAMPWRFSYFFLN